MTPATAGTCWTRTESPIGPLLLVGRPGVLTGVYVADHERCPPAPVGSVEDGEALAEPASQLRQYFSGRRTRFDLALDPLGTPFQRAVWAALLEVGYGQTVSYRQLAVRAGRPNADRAVGAANGRNPISIVIPCHRVIGSDGRLTGYGWGVARKQWLLDHEAGVLRLGS